MSETRDDAFLGGRLVIRQPVRGYRAGADPVFLAAAVAAKPGERVLELGCGVGTALLCLGARVAGLDLTGVERQVDLAELARGNAEVAGIAARIVTGDLGELPPEIAGESFDQVMFNPPFFDREAGSASPDAGREIGRGASETLNFWIDTALRRLRPGGGLTLVHRIEHLPAVLATIGLRAGGVRVLPLQPRRLKPAKLFLLRAKKGSKAAFGLLPPLVLHEGDAHVMDGESYTEAASAVLRKGAALSLDR